MLFSFQSSFCNNFYIITHYFVLSNTFFIFCFLFFLCYLKCSIIITTLLVKVNNFSKKILRVLDKTTEFLFTLGKVVPQRECLKSHVGISPYIGKLISWRSMQEQKKVKSKAVQKVFDFLDSLLGCSSKMIIF